MVTLWMLGTAFGAAEPQLDGRHVMTLHVVSRARVPIIGWIPTRTVTTVLLDLRNTGEHRYEQRHQVCGIEIINDTGQAKATIPPAFVRAMPVKVYDIEVAPNGDGWTYVADLDKDYIGFDPAVTKTVPERPRDPGVIDPDGDGHPGMTVLLRLPVLGQNELYVAQFGWLRVQGAVASADRIEGQLEVAAIEQRTLKASNPLLGLSPKIEAVPGASWFTVDRVPASTTCDSAKSRKSD